MTRVIGSIMQIKAGQDLSEKFNMIAGQCEEQRVIFFSETGSWRHTGANIKAIANHDHIK